MGIITITHSNFILLTTQNLNKLSHFLALTQLSFSPQCNVDYPECVIRLDFESFALSPNAMGRSRRQAESGNGTAATTQAPYVPPTGSDFNRTICAGEDVVRVSQCDSISTVNARE